jgi:hypothetical protein
MLNIQDDIPKTMTPEYLKLQYGSDRKSRPTGERRNLWKIFIEKPEGKTVWRRNCGLENNI